MSDMLAAYVRDFDRSVAETARRSDRARQTILAECPRLHARDVGGATAEDLQRVFLILDVLSLDRRLSGHLLAVGDTVSFRYGPQRRVGADGILLFEEDRADRIEFVITDEGIRRAVRHGAIDELEGLLCHMRVQMALLVESLVCGPDFDERYAADLAHAFFGPVRKSGLRAGADQD